MAVVVLHWGASDTTLRCLQSLREVSWAGRLAVFVIDNTGRLDQAEIDVGPSLEVTIDRPDRNLGFADGCTLGMSLAVHAGAEFVLLLNNDAIVDPSFLEPLVSAAIQVSDAGLLSPRIMQMGHPDRTWYEGGEFSLWSGIPLQRQGRPARDLGRPPREVDYATGCAMLVRPALIDRVGSFDPRFFAYCEDLDLSIRARRAGFRVLLVPASVVSHEIRDHCGSAALRIYYSTRNLIEVMRKHASWYQWPSFCASFAARWLGFFAAQALVRREPRQLIALARGIADGLRRRLGESAWVDDPRWRARDRSVRR